MANRRMFSTRITESARFLKMPHSSQSLYFHLGMKADDDGVVEAFPVMRMTNSTEDDLRVLVGKGFVTPLNEDLVVFLNDWLENNNLRADRKTDSFYKNLLLQVVPDAKIKEAKPSYYSRKKKLCQTNDSQMSDVCQSIVCIGKDSIGKDSIGKDRYIIDYQQIADMYNATCVSFPRLTKLSEKRKKAIKARLKTYTIDDFKKLFEMAEGSRFLKGQNGRNWSATFDWLITDGNMAKVLEGNYADRGTHQSHPEQQQNQAISDSGSYAVYKEMYKNLPTSPDDPFQ